jgi:hypothetical protein
MASNSLNDKRRQAINKNISIMAGKGASAKEIDKYLSLEGVTPAQLKEANVGPSGAMSFVNRAIADTVGAPADLIAGGLSKIPGIDIPDPALGSKDIARKMVEIGASPAKKGQAPQTVAEHTGEVVGQTAAMMTPLLGAIGRVAKTTGLAGNIANTIIKSTVKHPYLAMTSELTGGIGAGAGRGIALEQGAEDPTANLAEIGGGLIGGVGPTVALHSPVVLAARAGKNLFTKITVPFSKSGSKFRAARFIRSKVADPEKASLKIGQTPIGDLPPAVQSGEKRLLKLYKGISELDPVEDAKSIEKISNAIIKLENEMNSIGYGSPEVLGEILRKRVASIELGMDQRVGKALEAAQSKLDKIPVARRKSAESVIVRQELKAALSKERAEERRLWALVDKKQKIDIESTRSTYQKLYDDTAPAQQEDISYILKDSPITNPKTDAAKETTIATVKDLQGLRSKLLEKARIARADKKYNEARICSDVADAILNDIEIAVQTAPGAGGSPLQVALAQSRRIQDRFGSGTVGKILGMGRDGAPSIDPTMTLDVSVGRGGTKGAVGLEKITVSPEAEKATEKYIARSFTEYAAPDGKINPIKAQRWINNNEDILDKFPELRNNIVDARKAQRVADAMTLEVGARKAKLRDPKVSTSAKFLKMQDMGSGVEYVFKERNPTLAMRELVRMAGKDQSGAALEGLRHGVLEHIRTKSTVGPFDESGVKTLSGRAILGFVKNNIASLSQVFTKEQIGRLRRVGAELASIEKYMGTHAGKPDIEMDDWASNSLRLFSQIAGARLGGIAGRESAGGSMQMAQIMSGRFKTFMRFLTKNRAEILINDAILSDDPKLLQALLADIKEPGSKVKNIKELNKRMNAWLAGAGARVYEDIISEE